MVKIFNKTVKFLLDSGSNHSWWRLHKPALLRTKKTARSVTGDSINILSEAVLTVTLNGITKKLLAYVLKKHKQSIQYILDWKIQPLGLPYEHVLP